MDQFEAELVSRCGGKRLSGIMRTAFGKELGPLEEITVNTAVARQNHGHIPMAVPLAESAIVTATLDVTGLKSLFHTAVTIDDVGRAKPEPDLFFEALRRVGVPAPEHCRRASLECAPAAIIRLHV